MAKTSKKLAPRTVYPANAPCLQTFNLGNPKPGVKKKTWWNGYRQSAKPAES